MIRRIAPACAMALVLQGATALWSQEPTATGSLPSRTPCVRFEIVKGRFTAACAGPSQTRSCATAHPSGCPSESLTVSSEGGKPTVRYQLTDQDQELLIEFHSASDMRLTREPRGASGQARCRLVQASGGDLKLEIEIGGTNKQLTAPTMWHLLLAEPKLCRAHLLPALEPLRGDWRLCERAERLEAVLVELCQSGVLEQRRKCATLVDQLGSGNHQARQEADRDLRSMGQIVIPYLSRLDRTRLDAEQRQRLRRISEDLSVCTGDTPERAAVWMLDDQAVWLALLSHAKPEYRHIAALQLACICDRPIEFDPAAAEIERKAQIERLRERLVKGL